MATKVTARSMTVEEFAELPDDGTLHELVRGEVVTLPRPNYQHGPDVGFLAKGHPPGDRAGFAEGFPDLAIEIVSPSDRYTQLQEKALEWLAGGARLVVAIDPRRRTATVYRAADDIVELTADERLDASDAREGRALEEPTVAQVAVHYAAHHQDVLRRERWLGLLFAMMGAFWALEVAEARGTADLVLNLSLAVSALGAAIGWPVVCHRRARRLETTVRANKSAPSVS